MPFITQTERQSDFNLIPSTCPIVIDNGASNFRIGWAGETNPRVIFRNIVQRPRHKQTGETITVVGDHDPALLKYFDCTRSGPRSAFDNNVVYQFEIMEYVLDFGFDRLGATTQIDHPVLITECVCNPLHSRSKMAELLFETYGVPSVAFGVDAAFSFKYNQQLGVCGNDGLAISPGFNTTHAIPFINGEPVYRASCRTNIGGYHVTDYLKQLISLKYPHHMSMMTWEKVEDLKMEHCYIAPDYASEACLFQRRAKEAEDKTRCWQLPWVPPPTEEPRSEEELARKAAIKERQGQRLREMAEAKKTSRINELEKELQDLEFLLNQLKSVGENDMQSFLSETGYVSKLEIESALAKTTQSLRKAKGDQKTEQADVEDDNAAEKYPLINMPDNMLTPDQLKEKKRQLFLKTTAEGRQRAKQKRSEEEMEQARQSKLDEDKRLENPELYLEQMRSKHKELSEKVDQRKRMKTNGASTSGNGTLGGGVGRGERLNAAQKERMRLLTTAASDRGKGEDTFGARDEDWQLYKLMSRDNDNEDDGPDADETELARVSSRLQEIDPTFVVKPDAGLSQPVVEAPCFRPLTEEDFQVLLGVERFRCPEILFHPNLIGVDQVGLDEMAGVSFRRLPSECREAEERLTSSIFLTGGSSLYPGMSERIEAGVRMIRPCGTPVRVVRASDPILDAWRGAATYAAAPLFFQQTFSKMDYYEKGEDWLRKYQFKYNL